LLRLYLARTSDGKEDTLKFAIGLNGVMGMEPAVVPAAVAGLPGEGTGEGEGATSVMTLRSSGIKSVMK
jgi:hypothetical protein